MGELQQATVTWLSTLVALLPIGYAFGAGMIAAVNPCGFAMLPAYLSLYLGLDERASAPQRIWRAVVVGATVSSGFVLLFGIAGIIIAAGGHVLISAMPWLGALVGVALVVLGLALLAGRNLSLSFFDRLADGVTKPGAQTPRGFFLFGLAYGLASLGCSLPIFLVAVGGSLTSRGLSAGITQFISYGLGMTLVIITITVTLSLFKLGLVGWLKRMMPYMQSAAAVLLVVAGGSIVLYWSPRLMEIVRG